MVGSLWELRERCLLRVSLAGCLLSIMPGWQACTSSGQQQRVVCKLDCTLDLKTWLRRLDRGKFQR